MPPSLSILNIFRYPKFSETPKGSPVKFFRHCETKNFQRKIMIAFCIKASILCYFSHSSNLSLLFIDITRDILKVVNIRNKLGWDNKDMVWNLSTAGLLMNVVRVSINFYEQTFGISKKICDFF